MSDNDSFIDEVSEELRRDRMYGLWRRYGVLVIGAVVLIVAAAAALTWWDARQRAEAEAAGALLADAGGSETPEARAAAFAEAAQGLEGGPAMVARFNAAAAQVEADDRAGAVATLDAIAADGALEIVYRDLARLKSLQLRAPDMAPEEIIREADALAVEGAPFRLLGVELRAAAKAAAGDEAGARADLENILADQLATAGLRERAQIMLDTFSAPASTPAEDPEADDTGN